MRGSSLAIEARTARLARLDGRDSGGATDRAMAPHRAFSLAPGGAREPASIAPTIIALIQLFQS